MQLEPDDECDPCADGSHCCCCGPGEPCCDCGKIMPPQRGDLSRGLPRQPDDEETDV